MNSPKSHGRGTSCCEHNRHCPARDAPMSPALVCRTGTKFPNEQVCSMIGIVLVTHGRLAAAFRAALEPVVRPQKQIESIAIGPDDDIEQRRQDIVSAVSQVATGAGGGRVTL